MNPVRGFTDTCAESAPLRTASPPLSKTAIRSSMDVRRVLPSVFWAPRSIISSCLQEHSYLSSRPTDWKWFSIWATRLFTQEQYSALGQKQTFQGQNWLAEIFMRNNCSSCVMICLPGPEDRSPWTSVLPTMSMCFEDRLVAALLEGSNP